MNIKAETNLPTLKIDIISDVVCPWCVVGYKNLEAALKTLQGDLSADIEWHPFELNPVMGPKGQEMREHLAEKYGSSAADSDAVRARLTQLGQAVDFDFHWSNGMRIYNTFDCHRLLEWAKLFDKQQALQMALFEYYFSDNKALNDNSLLLECVARVGLDPEVASQVLQSEEYTEAVHRDLAHYRSLGIQSVPTFIINNHYAITGGQAIEVFVHSLRQIARESLSK